MSIQVTDRTAGRGRSVPVKVDAVVAGVALAAAVGVWSFWTQVVGVDLVVRSGTGGAAQGTQHIGVAAVVATALVVSLLGVGLLRLLESRTNRGLQAWTIVAVLFLAVSLLGPLGATSVAAALALFALHGTVALVLIVGLRQVRRHAAPRTAHGVA